MRAQDMTEPPGAFLPVIENAAGSSPVLFVCEHASNAFPPPWGDQTLLKQHICVQQITSPVS